MGNELTLVFFSTSIEENLKNGENSKQISSNLPSAHTHTQISEEIKPM